MVGNHIFSKSGLVVAVSLMMLMNSCFPPLEEDLTSIQFKLTDPVVQQILEARDKRQSDSLVMFFSEAKASYRYLAALSFASYQDTNAVTNLEKLLKDPVEEVRQAVVFSLGQIGHASAEKALIAAFIAVDSIGPFNKTNALILEALGKCGSDSTLSLICDISSTSPDDTLFVYGQMLSLYRFGLRNKFCERSLEKIIKVATNDAYPNQVRLMAAHNLQRFNFKDLNAYLDPLRRACNEEKDIDIRMCLVSALAKIPGSTALNALEELYTRGLDVRIQVNLLKGLSTHSSLQAQHFALKAVQNPSIAVSSTAAQYLLDKGSQEVMEELKELTDQKSLPWQVRSLLFKAALKHVPSFMVLTKNELLFKVRQIIQSSKNPYEKAAYIRVLTLFTKELTNLLSYSSSKNHPIVETTLAECIGQLLTRNDFYFIFKGSLNPIYPQLGIYLNRQCLNADPGTLAAIAEIFRKSNPVPTKYFNADSMLVVARQKLQLPKDVETYNELSKTISKRSGVAFIPLIPAHNHPILWTEVQALKDTIEAVIVTNKGDLQIQLYTRHAPGSVMNFVRLAKEGFYDNKAFHRVVPNFVVQSGCPRGDGYGALDYSLRTEISFLDYRQEGMMGMASAGNDTEGTQFFITHSPTPHLDGRYTNMGKLTGGKEILLSIFQGDLIQSIKFN